jgi:Rrf2 family transcriptional regulator, cysteine metabolism repressor
MKLSRTVEYALQATLQLSQAHTGIPVPCSQLAAQGNMPERFLLQILRNLVTHGILQSTRGVVGGYALERDLDGVSLLEIIEAIEGPVTSSIPSTAGLPDEAQARLGEAMARVTEIVRRELAAIKLSDLAPPPG